MEKLKTEVDELKKKEALVKKSAVEKFRSSSDFHDAIELTASKYFSEGFDFYKRQIILHHPNLDIDI